jgi:CheY-like chemotaxis protein/CheY-specific phosphatase CheX
MELKYLHILAQRAKQVFETMAGEPVYDFQVKPDQRRREANCIDVIVPYEYSDNRAKGAFVMALCDQEMAVHVASALAEKFGLPPLQEYDESVVEILNEFMNTVVGQTITAWDKEGLCVHFGPPHNSSGMNRLVTNGQGVTGYVIILHLKVGYLVFQVTFKERTSTPLQGKRILVVDDSSLIRNMLARALKNEGISVSLAEDGEVAAQMHRTMHPDLTIMDLVMPKLGGLETIAKIRQFDAKSRFIVLTSSSRKDQVVSAKNLHVDRYLLKPVKIPELMAAVRDLVSGTPTTQREPKAAARMGG